MVTKAQFDAAKSFVMPIGKHKGKTFNEVAAEPDGLGYLLWLADQQWFVDPSQHKLNQERGDHLATFLSWPAVAADVQAYQAEKASPRG